MDHTDTVGNRALEDKLLEGREGRRGGREHIGSDILLRVGGGGDLDWGLWGALGNEYHQDGADSWTTDGGRVHRHPPRRYAQEGLRPRLRHLPLHRRQYDRDPLLVRLQPSHHVLLVRRRIRRSLHFLRPLPLHQEYCLVGNLPGLHSPERIQPFAARRVVPHLPHPDLPAALFGKGGADKSEVPRLRAEDTDQVVLHFEHERNPTVDDHFQLLPRLASAPREVLQVDTDQADRHLGGRQNHWRHLVVHLSPIQPQRGSPLPPQDHPLHCLRLLPLRRSLQVSQPLFRFWIVISKSTPKDYAKSIRTQELTLRNYKEKSVIGTMEEMIPTAAMLGGVLIGFLTVLGDLLNVAGSSTGIMLSISILYGYY